MVNFVSSVGSGFPNVSIVESCDRSYVVGLCRPPSTPEDFVEAVGHNGLNVESDFRPETVRSEFDSERGRY